jgi:ABC-2 type transport system permease protein
MFIAIGLFFSTCTQNQIVAYLATLLLLGFLTFAGGLATILTPEFWGIPLRSILTYVGVGSHVAYFSKGEIGVSHLSYFLGFTALFLFLTYLILESRKWR